MNYYTKIYNKKLREARKDRKVAQTKMKNKKWVAMASTMSKEMMRERLSKTPKQMAKKHTKYLLLRARSSIDPTARKEYKKIVGRYPMRTKKR